MHVRSLLAWGVLLRIASIVGPSLAAALMGLHDAVDLLHNLAEEGLLVFEFVLKSSKFFHQVFILPVNVLFLLDLAVEHVEFVLELSLDVHSVGVFLILLLSVDGDEVGEFGSLPTVTDVDNDAHNNILESVISIVCRIGGRVWPQILGITGNIVAGVLALKLEDLVLIDQQVSTESLVVVLLDQLFHLLLCQHEEFGFFDASDGDIHEITAEEVLLIDD